MYPLWGSTPAQNHQLPSGDYAVAQGMFFRAYQRHQRSTIRIEKERTVNGSQRYASTAKVPNLSCKRVPRDSSLTTTKDGCNQEQTGPPTKSPRRMFHRKTAFTEVLFVCAQHLQYIPSPSTDHANVPLYKKPNKQRMKRSRQWDLNTRIGGL